ncbi:DNA polymerase IV [Pusillimonas sp. CC-YST705]|uniref:DNA polymerase IV n=1 Tax=Mesopusillimonas faecipullorum TaxID=2755040 RepID=A0ABS8CEH6_9BURK|nr:DNA polymerase IV [Mesopusillimonas faecipullorum]MCB5364232.1 DNA polymerase IV [Mesopusillimonas faecipullorum]
MSRRRIAHLDMDAFFASVELLHYPDLRGLPVVVGGRTPAPQQQPDGSYLYKRLRDYVGRGVVTTSTYEARQFGVFSAMGIMKAAQLAPDAILLPANFLAYREYSRRFKAAVASVADCIEDRGIDEIYIDLSEHPEPDDLSLAKQIKQAVRDATSLSCSIAISPNKLLSKIGSDLDKPDGVTLLGMEDIPARIWPLAVSKINGIGPKATVRLQAMGIQTIGQLAQAEAAALQEQFGLTYAAWLLRVAHGQDERPVVTYSEPKSVSRETTFERDLHVVRDRAELTRVLTQLCERVAQDLQRKQCKGRTIGVKLRFEDFRTVTRDHTVAMPTDAPEVILDAARQCLKRIPMHSRIRLLGIRIGKLSAWSPDHEQDPPVAQLSLY